MAHVRRALCAAAAVATASAQGVYTLTDADEAEAFWGVGGISGGGATSRLLFDYPEPQRSSILDLLFKPQFGAALQGQKVEVGGDADTTNGAEPSHRHDASDGGGYTRGYEGFLLRESLNRNPAIVTSALVWAAPRFIGEADVDGGGSVFTPAGAAYVSDWVEHGGRAWNLSVEYIGGGWNEHAFNATYIKLLRGVLDGRGLGATRVAASDEWSDPWAVGVAMATDSALRSAVDVLSVHVAGWMDHGDPAPPPVLALGRPIWQGEEHYGLPDPDPVPCWEWPAAGALGIEVNQNWVRNNMSSTVMWPHTYGWSAGIIYRGKGMVAATSPWGDAPVFVTTPLWIAAHTTHFTAARTWNLTRGGSSGFVAPGLYGTNVSFVTYLGPAPPPADPAPGQGGAAAPPLRDFTLVVESMSQGPWHAEGAGGGSSAAAAATATFALAGGLAGWAGAVVHVWHTNQSVTFVRLPDVTVGLNGTFTLTVEPAAIYTVTTVASAHPGAEAVMDSLGDGYTLLQPWRQGGGDGKVVHADAPFPLPYADDFEGYANDTLPLFTSDMFGSFATWALTEEERALHGGSVLPLRSHADPRVRGAVVCSTAAHHAQRPGRCTPPPAAAGGVGGGNQVLRQYVRQPPIGWNSAGSRLVTLLGNYTLSHVRVNISALIETPTPPVAGGDDGRTVALAQGGGKGVAYGAEYVYLGLRAGDGACAGCSSPSSFYGDDVHAYFWQLWVNGSWAVFDGKGVLASGSLPVPVGYDAWHALSFEDALATSGGGGGSSGTGVVLVGTVDGVPLFSLPLATPSRTAGYVLVGTGTHRAQFDNLLLDNCGR